MSADDLTRRDLAKPATLAEDWEKLPASSDDWVAGQRLGPYRLKRQLGKGGMGVVWLAEQLQPLQREVAIKLLPRGQNQGLSEIYFEIERQALAQLSHRSIAQIFDAGRLPDGALFFAMEYVPGVPLDEFLEAHDLSLSAIVALMVQICLGAHHAHQRALIHRDLKPLNILVQMADGQPLPKIIDFGVAIGALPGSAARLGSGKTAGTPAYMSPEQKKPGPAGIDARSDVYALGAVFAECLHLKAGIDTAHDRFESTTLRDGLERSRGGAASASHEGSEAQASKLKTVPEELRAIAIKALAPERDDRYDSAAAMADDLDQWLRKRPVRAMGGGRWYAARCFVNRYRLATAASAAIVIALLIGVLMAVHGQNQARAAQALAEKRRDDAEQLVQFMLGDFADKLRPIGRLDLLDSIGSEALAYLSAQNAGGDASSALNRARALRTLGEVQVTRQQFDQASVTLEAAATLIAPWTVVPNAAHAEHIFESGQIAYYRGLIAYRKRELDTAEMHWQQYLRDARAFSGSTLDSARGAREIAYALTNLGTLAQLRERFEEALAFFDGAATIRKSLNPSPGDTDSLDLANSLSWKASAYNELGRPLLAHSLLREALTLLAAFGEVHPDHADRRQREINFRLTLAQISMTLNQVQEARTLLEGALELAKVDLTNDPTQPRRRAMLARIALSLSRLWPAGAPEGTDALSTGASEISELPSAGISDADRVTLDALLCLARLNQRPDEVDCALVELGRLSGQNSSGSDSFAVADRAFDLWIALSREDPLSAHQLHPKVIEILDAVPPARRKKLRYLQLQHALLKWTNPDDEGLRPIDAQIRSMTSPTTHDLENIP
jgi:eukaryotic-like serine/threonine-protein kinase